MARSAAARGTGRTSDAEPARVRVYIATSVDGFIADGAGGVEWLTPFFSPEIDFAGFTRTIGATIWGRATFDQALERGERFDAQRGRTVVWTRRPLPEGCGAEAFAGDPRELVGRLRDELAGTGKDIWLGGGGVSIRPFHEAGLIDRWEISVIPVVLGSGIPLFTGGAGAPRRLGLVHHRALGNGIVELHYTPTVAGPA